jgi:orotidine-5'-phosphate decarboxylase
MPLVDELGDLVSFYKVGLQLFIAEGMPLLRELSAMGKRIFLDLKMDDVDETIASAVREIVKEDVQLITLQGSSATMRAAVAGRGERTLPKLLLVTLLSSLNEDDLVDLQLVGPNARFATLMDYVLWRAEQGKGAGCDGFIASGESIAKVRERVGPEPLIVSPGIRPGGAATDEHKRPTTPGSAIQGGADYLVVGRPVRQAKDRRGTVSAIIEEIAAAAR